MSIFFLITIVKTLEFFFKNIYIRTIEYSALLWYYDIFLSNSKVSREKKTEYTVSMMEIYRFFSIDPPRDSNFQQNF